MNKLSLMSAIKSSVIFLLMLVQASASAASNLQEGILASIETIRSEYSSSDKLEVRVSYTNTTSKDVRFLKWNTALEGDIRHDFLFVSLDGEELPYIGIHIKRLPPKTEDFITIKPGQTVSAVVDLSLGYEISEQGTYSLLYQGVTTEPGEESFKKAGGTFLNVTEVRPLSSASQLKRTPIIDPSCNATQRNQINQALTIAENIGVTAINALNNAPLDQRSTARRYREWFGAYSASNYETVRRGMARISDALVNRQIGFDCTCNIQGREGIYAFVRPNDPFNMNVCPVFFQTTASGTDSRAGTIIHEISHFTVVAGSDDFNSAFDQAGSRRLANSNPSSAIRNANAFEYFAENTPFLSMPEAAATPTPETEPTSPTPTKDIIITPILPLLIDESA